MKSILLAVILSTLFVLTPAPAPTIVKQPEGPTIVVKQEGEKWTWVLSYLYNANANTKAEYKLQSTPFNDKQSCIRSLTSLYATYGNPSHCNQVTGGGGEKAKAPAAAAAAATKAAPAEQQGAAFDTSQLAAGSKPSCGDDRLVKALNNFIYQQTAKANMDTLAAKVGLKLTFNRDFHHPSMDLATKAGQRILHSPDNVSTAADITETWSNWLLVGTGTGSYKIAKHGGGWAVTLEAMDIWAQSITAKVGSKDVYGSEEEAKKARDEAIKHVRKILHVIITGEAPTEQQKKKEQQPPAKKEQQPGKKVEQPKKEQQLGKKKEQPVANKKEQQPAKKPAEQPAKKQQQGQAEAHDDNDVSEDDTEDDSDDDDEADF